LAGNIAPTIRSLEQGEAALKRLAQ
jgi:hypothetical protein